MKKQWLVFTLTTAVMLSVVGCGIKSSKMEDAVTKDLGYKVSDYVKLGEYKGIEVGVTTKEVTDADVEQAIQADLQQHSTEKQIKKGTIKNGDTVNIDYEGKKDGKAFDGGTAKGQNLTIGSKSFIDGFEEKLIGVKVGETVDLDLTFPKDYQSKDLAGKAVVFTVKVNYLVETIVPELNEKYVTSNSEYKTVEEYRAGKRKELTTQNTEATEQEKLANVWQTVISKAKIDKYPEKELKTALKNIRTYYEGVATQYGMEFGAFLEQMEMSEKTFDKDMKPYAEESVAQKMVFYSIVIKENFSLTDKEFNDGVKKLMTDTQQTDKEKFLKENGEKEVKEYLLKLKVQEYLVKNAKFTKATPTPAPEAETEAPAEESPAAK